MIKALFLNHPSEVDETYGQHFVFALRFSGLLFLAAGAALVHAVIPALCERTAGRIVTRLNDRIQNR